MSNELFEDLRTKLLNADPVAFCENNLTLDGKPFKLSGNGYKPLEYIFRYVGVKALERNSKPIIFCKGRQTSGTTTFACLSLYWGCSGQFGKNGKPPIRVLHCFPQAEHAQSYAKKKLNVMIATAKIDPNSSDKKKKTVIQSCLDTSVPTNDSLSFKQWINNNTLSIESLGIAGDRARGLTVDCLIYDEAQLIRGAAIANSSRAATTSSYGRKGAGVQIFLGTPLSKGTEFHKMWMASSMNYFHLGCESCGKLFALYTPDSDDWKETWIEDDLPKSHPSHGFIVKCRHCNHLQDKREAADRGDWISVKLQEESTYEGFHLSCLLMNFYSRERIFQELPENSPINNTRTFENEIMGNFYSGESGPISMEMLDEKCAETERPMVYSIKKEPTVKVFAGFDWGEKNEMALGENDERGRNRNQGKSYSCGVVLKTLGPELLSVEFCTKLKRNDMTSKLEIVEEMFRLFNIDLAVGDIGGAGDLSDVLHKTYGDQFIPSRAVGPMKNHVSFIKDRYPPEIQFERDYHYAELYDVLKKGMIKFPYKSYDKIEWLLYHITQGNDIKVSMDSRGELISKFVKSGNNDGFCALLNAYLAWKFYQSDGFNVFDPKKMNKTNKPKPILALLGHFPSWKGHM